MKVSVKNIKGKQVLEWVASGKAILRNDLRRTDLEDWLDFYVLESGELLLVDKFEKRNGTLYPNFEDYQKMMDRFDQKQSIVAKNTDKATGAFNEFYHVSQSEFEQIIPKSATLLANEFKLDPNKLDYSIESLKVVHREMKKYLRKNDTYDFIDHYFVLITAYCGEIMKREINGEWQITGDGTGRINKVVIVEKENPEYSYLPQLPLNEILSGDAGKGITLLMEVRAHLGKHDFIKGGLLPK
ncbi:hypothetical protein FA048_08135 [Pedobacter polaris]|uniref:Uncharacterized protein n=1 Tax=Pedobacter polaris TaxID=2571273 RepID=A0A4U1CVE4_9SPHI|nr:hypothetical protein [Pedobacter polaris]TKC10159.1 hypothetical protein FA048_08135 [Pedobacter polaris]